jgi:Zn-dependent M28 family amino/carboxypeptidase
LETPGGLENPLHTMKHLAVSIALILSTVDAKHVEHTINSLVSFGTRNTLSAQDDPKRGVGAARDWIQSEFQKIATTSGGRMTVELQSFEQQPGRYARMARPTKVTNVVATLRGTKSPDRVYVVSGHYDSMCTSPTDADCDAPGANDDASGVAVVLEAARVMAPHPFDATIVFMAVAGEEQGLVGSTYFAEQAKKNGMNIEGVFTNDIVGHGSGSVRVFSEGVPSNETEDEAKVRRNVGGENDSASRQLARFIDAVAAKHTPKFDVWMIYRRDRYLRGGDHIPFLEQGYPAVRFTEPHENYDHQHQNVRVENGKEFGDLPKFDDFRYIANVARVNVAALAELASAPARPKNVRIVTARLTNDTDLAWETSDDADHYEIVWRDTTSPVWQHSRAAGQVTTYTIKDLSKDNYIFGVRAVDAAGHRSPAVYPKPAR